MLIDKIKNFYTVRSDYFKKKKEIANAMLELDYLLHEAKHALSDTIDNGFDNEYIVKVAKAYEKHKFGSKIVQEFLEKIDEMFFKDIDAKLKDSLEIVSLKIDLDYYDKLDNRDARVNGPIYIYVSDSAKRHFTIMVPIKDSVNVDMIQWNESKDGLYVLWVKAPNTRISKEACCVFDYSKMPIAIEKYLKGEFDKELDAGTYMLDTMQEVSSNKTNKYFTYTYKPTVEAYSYKYDDAFSYGLYNIDSSYTYNTDHKDEIEYIEKHDLFGWREASPLKSSSRLSNCIDDRRDYK